MKRVHQLKLLIVPLRGIRGCVHALPLLRALRRNFPQSIIAWAAEDPYAQLVDGHPDLNQTIRVPRRWMKSIRNAADVRTRLRQTRFDVAFDPFGDTESAALAWLSGARIRVGFPKGAARGMAPWLNNRRVDSATVHHVDRVMDLLRGIDVRDAHVDFRVPVAPIEANRIRSQVRKLTQLPFLAIHPGGTSHSPSWPPEHYATVARFTRRTLGLRSIVTWSGADERAIAQSIVRLSHNAAIAAPETSLKQLAALISQSVMYVGEESGPMHLAAALAVPCVAIFGASDPRVSGPYGAEHIVLPAAPPLDFGASAPRLRAPPRAEVSVEDVCQAIGIIHQRRVRTRTANAS